MVYLMRNGTYSYLCVYTGDAEWETEKWEGTPSGEFNTEEGRGTKTFYYICECVYIHIHTNNLG